MKRCRYCRQEDKKVWVRQARDGEKTGGGRANKRSQRCQAGVGEVGWEMQQTSLSPHLEVPEVVTEGAALAGTHGCVVQTGGHTLGYSFVPELHPALCVVLAVLGSLFPSRGRGCCCLLLAPHEPTCVPKKEQWSWGQAQQPLSSQNLPADRDPTSRSL